MESAKIIAMNINKLLEHRTAFEVKQDIRNRFRLRRKEHRLSQAALAEKADVSLGSLKRFESSGEISLTSLIKLAFALGYEKDFDELFAQTHYRSIEDVIRDAANR